MTSSLHLPPHIALSDTDRAQLSETLVILEKVLTDRLVGAYLHGSAVIGGLQPRSDLDVLAVSAQRMTLHERKELVARLLDVSGDDPDASPLRPLEVTVVVWSEVHPWRYPPTIDLQYGEWWRAEFEAGDLQPWPSRTNPDLAPIIKMALLGDAALAGPPPMEVFDPVPDADLEEALVAGVGQLLDEIDSDATNVVLTLARVWNGVVTHRVESKPAAAAWAVQRLAPEHRAVLDRARDIYQGVEENQWVDSHDRLRSFADAVVQEIRGPRT